MLPALALLAQMQVNLQTYLPMNNPQVEIKVEESYIESYIKKPLIAETKTTKSVQSKDPSHRFPWGWCTYYVASKRSIPWSGNANTWLAGAKFYGYLTGTIPEVGAVVVMNESWLGHVGLVEDVSGNEITISEMNYIGFGIVSSRKVAVNYPAIKGYIY